MIDEQIKEIKEQIRKGIQRKENIREKYDKLREKYKNKEQECERLKHDNGYEVGALEKTIDNLKAENDLFRTCHDNEQAKRRNLEQTLTEIKEIAERDRAFCIKCNGDKDIDCVDCIEGGRALLAKDILQKISECEGNDE